MLFVNDFYPRVPHSLRGKRDRIYKESNLLPKEQPMGWGSGAVEAPADIPTRQGSLPTGAAKQMATVISNMKS